MRYVNQYCNLILRKATVEIDSQVNFRITKADTLDWTIQLSQDSITLDSGVEYTITLDAWSTANRVLSVWIVEDKEPAVDVGGDTIYLTPAKKNYTVKITPPFPTTRGIFQLLASRDTLPVFADNIHMYRSIPVKVIRNQQTKNNIMGYRRSGEYIYWTPLSPHSNITLMNINGKIVKPSTATSPLRLTNLSAGIYMLTIDDGMGNRASHMIHKF